VHGLGASLRQMLTFARPWQRVVLGVALFVVATVLRSYFLAALGLVIAGVAVLGAVRARRGVPGVSEAATAEAKSETDAAVGEQP
jgi:hypothetical protein